jgi:hypothetical protein
MPRVLCNGRGQFVLFVRVQPLFVFYNVSRNARMQGALLNESEGENAKHRRPAADGSLVVRMCIRRA